MTVTHRDADRKPLVCVVIPMLDERRSIEACLDSFAAQTYPLDRLEVVVVDGGSTDGSRQYVDLRAESESWIRVVDNPLRKASAAFNAGVAAARGDVVCLFSAHGVADPDYVRTSVEVLLDTGASGVGGRYEHRGTDPGSNAIGLAMVSPFGMASPHRFVSGRCEVDTISHPAYRRSALVEIGPFDEGLERNSDYELNWRLRAAGHTLLFDPDIRSIYRPRPSLGALGRQFWAYGRWKARVIERHPRSLRLRHLVAPAAVAGAALGSPFLVTRRGRRLASVVGSAYGLAVAAAVARARPRRHDASPIVLGASFPVMHGCWGAGFLTSAVEDALRSRR
jgi:succinoglycan biosynthesis protein ExoA